MPSDAAMNIVNTVFAGGSKADVMDQIGDQLSAVASDKIEKAKQEVMTKYSQIHQPLKDIEDELTVQDCDPATGLPYELKQKLVMNNPIWKNETNHRTNQKRRDSCRRKRQKSLY